MDVRLLKGFADWLAQLRDAGARVKITSRLARLAHDNPGDAAPVGDGVSEMRIHSGPGYRVYYLQHGAGLAVVLLGGDKRTQAKDIEAARALAKRWKEEDDGDGDRAFRSRRLPPYAGGGRPVSR